MKRTKLLFCVLTLLLSCCALPLGACAQESQEEEKDTTLAPYFIMEDADSPMDLFPLKETNVTANINGVVAETYVEQTYANDGEQPIHARYVFPASTRVSVHGMKMIIGDQVVTALIKEKEEAKEEYEAAKSEGKSASLLEEQRPNVFTMNVANIMPGDVVRIELHYTEMLSPTDGNYQFVFPAVVGPRYAEPIEASAKDQTGQTDQWAPSPYLREGVTPAGKYHMTVNLATGVPISRLYCRSHEADITLENDSTAHVTLTGYGAGDFAGNRDFILDYRLTGEELNSGLTLETGEDENFFMLTVQPPERFTLEAIPPREYIFVLDVSGSMYGFPLDTAKELIRNLVSNLRETDSFNVILFSDTSIRLSGESVPATKQNIKYALNMIDSQEGGGGTRLAPVLMDALSVPAQENVSRSIVTITDGYISGEKEVFDIINRNLNTASFFSFGIGDSVNRYLIEGIAKAGLGESFVVTDPSEATDTAGRFRTYIQSPVLTDIQIVYDGFDVYDVEPSSLPTLFAQRPLVIYGKWRGEPEGTIRITGRTGNGTYTQELAVSDVNPLASSQTTRYLWARTKVEGLIDYGYLEEEQEALQKEVTELGLKYSILTPYTSFIAVTETVRNPAAEGTNVDQPLPLPSNVSELSIGNGYTVGSEPDGLILLFAMLSLLSVSYLLRRQKRKSYNR